MLIKEVIQYLNDWAAPAYAESYDNVGLLTGNAEDEVKGVLVSLDCTEAVVAEAVHKGCNVVVSHHPIIFKGLKKITGSNYVERTVISAIRNQVALYAIHTNLDSISTGVNARIAQVLGLENVKILRPKGDQLRKLTFFAPETEAEKVRKAVFSAGAGTIGNYRGCSFSQVGTGTFTPGEGALPTVGAVGKAELVVESRVEVMYPAHLEPGVLAAMRHAHTYEEVAYYISTLENENQFVGSGMVGNLPTSVDEGTFLATVRNAMHCGVVRHTALLGRHVRKVALCGGAGSFLLGDAIKAGADVFITADFKYHEFFDAEGKIVIADIGHYESEQFTINLIAGKLSEKFSTFATRLTEVNTNPIHYL